MTEIVGIVDCRVFGLTWRKRKSKFCTFWIMMMEEPSVFSSCFFVLSLRTVFSMALSGREFLYTKILPNRFPTRLTHLPGIIHNRMTRRDELRCIIALLVAVMSTVSHPRLKLRVPHLIYPGLPNLDYSVFWDILLRCTCTHSLWCLLLAYYTRTVNYNFLASHNMEKAGF